jgi:hypothetical protein
MLGDAAGFALQPRRMIGWRRSNEVLPWSTWPITVTTGRAGHKLRGIVRDIKQPFFHVGFGHAADAVAHFLGDELGSVGIDDVVDRCHLALLHQQADDIDRTLGHAVGKVLDADRFGDRHLTHKLFLRLGRSDSLESLGTAAE